MEKDEYPIHDLLDFLDSGFPERRTLPQGFGRSLFIPSEKEAIVALQERLRAFIDDWIASGFSSDGTEKPYERNLDPVSLQQVFDPVTGRCIFSSLPRSVSAMAQLLGGSLQIMVPREGELHYCITRTQLSDKHAEITTVIHPQGGFVHQPTMGPAPMYSRPPTLSRDDEAANRALNQALEEDLTARAAKLFMDFYGSRSQWLFRLMRCNRCGGLATPKRKPRSAYLRGWHCPPCSKRVPAILSMSKSRAEKRERWFAFAVSACKDWNASRHRSSDRIAWITNRVNRSLRLQERIKRNTISRNIVKIEEEAGN